MTGEDNPRRMTRREVVRGAIATGTVLGAGGVLAGCLGDDDAPSAGEGASTGGNLPRGGSLRVGVAGGGGAKDSLDAHKVLAEPDYARVFQLYEPLAIRNAAYEFEMILAESFEPNKTADEWTVRLKPDVTFHNGKPLTADDVLFSLRRILDPDNPGTGAAGIGYVDAAASKKLDERTLRVKLKTPSAVFPEDVGQYFNGIVPVDYDPKKPVGTGAFAYKSFSPGESSTFVANQNYWRPDEPKVDDVSIVNFADETARVNALLAGQVHAITNLPYGQISSINANSRTRVLEGKTGNWSPFVMRVDQAPFTDVRVRQAMRLIADREQLINQALNGQGTLANDLYSPFDPAYAGNDFPQREQDLEQAKSLLKQAGQADLRITLATADFYQGVVAAAQILAEQAKGAGVEIRVNKLDPGTFFADYLNWTFSQDHAFTRSYLQMTAIVQLPESTFNAMHWEDQEYVKIVRRARLELDEPRRFELLKEAQRIQYDRGGYLVYSFANQVDGYSAEVRGFRPSKAGFPLGGYNFRGVGLAS